MGTAWLETVLVSDEINCVGLAIISNKRVRSLDGQRFSIRSNVVQDSGLFVFESITGLDTVDRKMIQLSNVPSSL
jgi:hypothetical protein